MYKKVYIFLLLCTLAISMDLNPLSDEFIDHINRQGKWKAGRNFHPDTPISYLKNLLGAKISHDLGLNLPAIEHDPNFIKSLPKSFDPREKWSNCPSLNEIRDQGACGSCWAFGAVEAMTDRVCIYSNGSKNFHFSAQDLLTCAQEVGSCRGGYSELAWDYWMNEGIVSGGNYGSNEGCRPYTLPPCNHINKGNLPDCTTQSHETPACAVKCRNGYDVPYKGDKRRGKRIYLVKGEDNIKAELFKNGPLEARFVVYADFIHYKGDVYEHLTGVNLGHHAVKVLGWGEEDGKKYWLAANSWNDSFGLKGFFKIKRGVDECNIESNPMMAGEPALEDY